MKKVLMLALVLASCYLVGCPQDRYEIAMRPTDKGLERTITVSLERNASQAASQVAALERQYGQASTASSPAATQSFRRVFTGATLPADVGNNAGRFLTYQSQMGKVQVYLERFRGSFDFAQQIEKRFAACDRLAELLVGWFDSETRGKPGAEKIHTFLSGRFRQDLKNVAALAWAHKRAACPSSQSASWSKPLQTAGDSALSETAQGFADLAQFILERGYLRPDDLPVACGRIFGWGVQDEQSQERFLRVLRDRLAELAGLTLQEAETLEFLQPEPAKKSLDAFLAKTPEYQRRLRKYEAEQAEAMAEREQAASKAAQAGSAPASQPSHPPEPTVILGDLTNEIIRFAFGGGGVDALLVSLSCATQPAMANGEYDAMTGVVGWTRPLETLDSSGEAAWPYVAYALICQPDETYQQAHLGKIVFGRGELIEYQLWHESLTAAQRQQWDRMIDSLRGGPAAAERVKAFIFDDEKARGIEPDKGVAKPIIERIVSALAPESQPAK